MKKVLVITYYWPPSGGAGVQRALKFVKYFPQFGIEPIVLTVNEKSAFYPFIDESLRQEISPSAKVIRTKSFEPLKLLSAFIGKKSIPQGGFSNQNQKSFFQTMLRFIRGNFFVPDARSGWIRYAYREACRIIESDKPDCIMVSSPPHSSQLVGVKLKKKFGIRFIADMRDPWTNIYYYDEMLHLLFAKAADLKKEKKVLEHADAVVSVSKEVRNFFIKKAQTINTKKFFVIPNGFDEDDFQIRSSPPADEFCITYTGTIAQTYKPDIFFDALENVAAKNPDVKFRLRFVGSVYNQLIERIKSSRLSRSVELNSAVSHREAVRFMLVSSVLLLVIPESASAKGILTGKLFEYLAAKKPIINIGPADGDAAEIISECAAGKTFERTNVKAIENYLTDLVNRWKQNSNLDLPGTGIEKYSRQVQTKELADIIHNLTE